MPELQQACKDHGIEHTGRKATLIALLESCTDLHQNHRVDLVQVRHPDLFRRLYRSYLNDHRGDPSRLVLADLGLQQHVDYA